MRKLRKRRAGGRTSADDGTDAGRTGSERPDNPGTDQTAKQIADLEREIEQRKQSREYRSIADKIKANITSETDNRKRADAEVVAWKFKYEKAEQAKRYAQTHQKTVEVPVEKKVPYEKCDNCDRTAYQKAKEKCYNRKIQLEKKYKNMTAGYESLMFLLTWYSIATTLFTAILSPTFFNDCITFLVR